MKNMKLIKSAAVMVSLSVVIVAIGFGCGVGYTPNGGVVQSSTGPIEPPSTLPGNIDGLEMVPGSATFGTAIYTSYYNSLLSKLNLDPSVPAQVTNVLAEFNNQREALSDTGKATGINGAYAFATTALSAAACLDRINYERNNPTMKLYFNEVDLNAAPGQLSDSVLKMVINRLSRGLYGDNETAAEDNLLIADVKASMDLDTLNDATETREAMLYICTAMSASTSGLRQ